MVTIEVTPDDPEVARVGPKGKVEQIADQRNRADGRVDEGVRPHAGEMPFRHAEVARFPDDIGRHERGQPIADDRDQPDKGAEPAWQVDAGPEDSALPNRPTRLDPPANRESGMEGR